MIFSTIALVGLSRHAGRSLRYVFIAMKYLICPLCSQSLSANSQGVSCVAQHQFDRAKEGYFNLLPAQHKHSREPGDAKAQLRARRTFLQANFYLPLLTGLQQLVPDTTRSLLDIGCGEGYFVGAFAGTLGDSVDVYGIDIAKEAVRLAAKQYAGSYAVASSYALPIADGSMDVVTRIYAPSKNEELLRVLAPEGRVIIVTPGQNHLLGLRQSIYQTVRPHPEPEAPNGLVEVEWQKINFDIAIPAGVMTEALLLMTPFAWRLTREKMNEIILAGCEDQVDFTLCVYQRK